MSTPTSIMYRGQRYVLADKKSPKDFMSYKGFNALLAGCIALKDDKEHRISFLINAIKKPGVIHTEFSAVSNFLDEFWSDYNALKAPVTEGAVLALVKDGRCSSLFENLVEEFTDSLSGYGDHLTDSQKSALESRGPRLLEKALAAHIKSFGKDLPAPKPKSEPVVKAPPPRPKLKPAAPDTNKKLPKSADEAYRALEKAIKIASPTLAKILLSKYRGELRKLISQHYAQMLKYQKEYSDYNLSQTWKEFGLGQGHGVFGYRLLDWVFRNSKYSGSEALVALETDYQNHKKRAEKPRGGVRTLYETSIYDHYAYAIEREFNKLIGLDKVQLPRRGIY